MRTQDLMGSYVAIATPMLTNGEVDYDALEKLIEFHVENGTHGIVSVGTTGESATLNVDEHIAVVEFTVKKVAGRIQVIAGTGANSTSEAIHLTKLASNAGVDACLLVVPYYNKPTQEGLFQHFKSIAEAVDIPQILYNVPGRTVLSMANETAERLSNIDNIIGIKDATGDMELGADLVRRVGDKMAVLSGDDATALGLIKAGGKGNISVTANIAPKMMSDLCVAGVNGDFAAADKINDELAEINQQLFVESNPIPVKWALEEMGLTQSGIRLPLTRLAEEFHAGVSSAMKKLGLI
ncbi:MAG: 4-hydroxy-tetrahydrodipicolinate synthase [Arenicella sp.]